MSFGGLPHRQPAEQSATPAPDAATDTWAEWSGEGPAPAKWWATNPKTGERILVYRSYEDYVDD